MWEKRIENLLLGKAKTITILAWWIVCALCFCLHARVKELIGVVGKNWPWELLAARNNFHTAMVSMDFFFSYGIIVFAILGIFVHALPFVKSRKYFIVCAVGLVMFTAYFMLTYYLFNEGVYEYLSNLVDEMSQVKR